MSEYRISYNPYTKDYISGCQSHSIQLYNQGKQACFDDYIRGIILDNVLYLRVYYPFSNIDTLTSDKLYKASYKLLKDNIRDILQVIKDKENIIIHKIEYNVTNDILSGLKLCNI
jgi:hypothetical protein